MAELRLYDEIGWYGITAEGFATLLGQVPGDIDLFINSPGGSVGDALAMHASLIRHPGQVRVTVDGMAASAASVVAMAADPGQLAMAPGALIMIHEAWAEAAGNAAAMRSMADVLDKASSSLAGIYAARAGHGTETWRGLMAAETWFTADEAVRAGLADRVAVNAAA